MSENVKAIIKNHEVPTNHKLCRDLWWKVMAAFRKEDGLYILNNTLYSDLLDLRMASYRCPEVFFGDHDINNMPDGYSERIAAVANGSAVDYVKDKDGVGFLYSTDESGLFIKFGDTLPINGYRYPFYQSNGIYVIYHNTDNDDGCAREVRTLSGLGGYNTKYYDETGSTNLMTNAKGMWEDFKRIFQ